MRRKIPEKYVQKIKNDYIEILAKKFGIANDQEAKKILYETVFGNHNKEEKVNNGTTKG